MSTSNGSARSATVSGYPASLVELLRFCIVIFAAGLGFQIAEGLGNPTLRLGPFEAPGVGTIIGAGLGYVLGGVLGRFTIRRVRDIELSVVEFSVEQVLAGLAGAVVGTLIGGGLTWPVLLVGSTLQTVPIFLFVCVVTGSLGYRVGLTRREPVLDVLRRHTALTAGPRVTSTLPRLLDSSALVDGRIVDIVAAGFLHGDFLVTEPVLAELQGLADSADDSRRAKGRRALDALAALRRQSGVHLEVITDEAREIPEVDAKLVRVALDRGAALVTLDTALARIAALSGAHVMNLHSLTLALRPPVVAGETLNLMVTRTGREPGQGVGYLDDGTMIVVENAADALGQELSIVVLSVLLTANGRLIFARRAQAVQDGAAPVPRPRPPARRTGSSRPETAPR